MQYLIKKSLAVLWVFLFLNAIQTGALAQGIEFSKIGNWKAVVDQARSEGKFIFVDCYTTWCHPCRLMAAQVFSDERVGALMREKFISVKLQMDSTQADNDFVKEWYSEAHHINSTYQVRSYPTFLYFDPNGQIVHKSVGAIPVPEFLRISSSALMPDGQYYNLLQRISKGNQSQDTYISAFTAALGANENNRADSLFRIFWNQCNQTDKSSPHVLSHAAKFVYSTNDPVFPYLLKEALADSSDSYQVGGNIRRTVKKLIKEEIDTLIACEGEKPNFDGIGKQIIQKYPSYALELLVKAKLDYYKDKNDWEKFVKTVDMARGSQKFNLAFDEVMNYAYLVYSRCADKQLLRTAENWLNAASPEDELPTAVIRSLLQYRRGERQASITLMRNTIDKLSASGAEQPELQHLLSRMNRGEDLWTQE